MFLTSLLAGALAAGSSSPNTDFAVPESPIVWGPRIQDAEAPEWTGSVNVGATLTTGNSETLTLSSSLDAERKTDEDRWTASLYWFFSEQEDDLGTTDVTQREYGGKVQYDLFADDKTYYYFNLSGDKDDIAGLQFRAILGAGAGYQFRDTEEFSLNGEAGLSAVHEDNEDISNPIPPDTRDAIGPDEYIAARLAYNAGYQYSETTRFEQSTQVFPSLKEWRGLYGMIDTTMSVSMTEAMSLRLQHILEYDRSPAVGADRIDQKLILGISWAF